MRFCGIPVWRVDDIQDKRDYFYFFKFIYRGGTREYQKADNCCYYLTKNGCTVW